MNKFSALTLRLGLAVTFLIIGWMIYQNPEGWGSLMRPWAAKLLPLPLGPMMLSTAVLDIGIGFLLLVNRFTWLAAIVGGLHILMVLIVTGLTDVTVRDLGLIGATLALTIETMPASFRNRYAWLR